MADILGYAASLAVLATFTVRTMVPLRVIAILSNVLFVVYGYEADIRPVLVLHLVLLPINLVRLAGLMRRDARRLHERSSMRDRSAPISGSYPLS